MATKKRYKPRNDLEHQHQAALFNWASLNCSAYPELSSMFAIPNGGARHIAVAVKLKAEGVKAGVPDLMLPVSRKGYNGLFIEMKTEEGSEQPNQKKWRETLIGNGYLSVVCKGWDSARFEIMEYLRA